MLGTGFLFLRETKSHVWMQSTKQSLLCWLARVKLPQGHAGPVRKTRPWASLGDILYRPLPAVTTKARATVNQWFCNISCNFSLLSKRSAVAHIFSLSTLSKQAEHILHVHPVIFRNLLTFLTFYMPELSPAALLILSTWGHLVPVSPTGGWVGFLFLSLWDALNQCEARFVWFSLHVFVTPLFFLVITSFRDWWW
jgi:hypothetical protein